MTTTHATAGSPVFRLILLALFFSGALVRLAEAAEVTVLLKSGRSFTAEISSRSDKARLWLRFGNRSTMLLRPVSWTALASATMQGREVSLPELREMAANVDDDLALQRAPRTAPRSNNRQALRESETAQQWLGMTPSIKTTQFDAHIANWDADVEADGLVVHVQPFDETGRFVDASGVLNVELFAPRSESFSQRPAAGGLSTVQMERWTVRLQAKHRDGNEYVVYLPFRRKHPEFDLQLGTYGLVHTRLSVPGHGVFEQSEDGVRLRAFAPSRDRLQQQTGRRFLATERTGK